MGCEYHEFTKDVKPSASIVAARAVSLFSLTEASLMPAQCEGFVQTLLIAFAALHSYAVLQLTLDIHWSTLKP